MWLRFGENQLDVGLWRTVPDNFAWVPRWTSRLTNNAWLGFLMENLLDAWVQQCSDWPGLVDGWMIDRWMGRCPRVSDLFSSLHFQKGGDDKGEAQTQAPLSALSMLRDLYREDTGKRDSKRTREREPRSTCRSLVLETPQKGATKSAASQSDLHTGEMRRNCRRGCCATVFSPVSSS